jgi:hypothetical protein
MAGFEVSLKINVFDKNLQADIHRRIKGEYIGQMGKKSS